VTTVSRKEFLRQGAASLGRTVLQVGAALSPAVPKAHADAAQAAEPREPGADMVAAADNRHCLARGCGCFTCLERCAAGAIRLVPGEGIGVDAELCTGCGICETVCPVAPKAVRLQPRKDVRAGS
jgi:ferredoxin